MFISSHIWNILISLHMGHFYLYFIFLSHFKAFIIVSRYFTRNVQANIVGRYLELELESKSNLNEWTFLFKFWLQSCTVPALAEHNFNFLDF